MKYPRTNHLWNREGHNKSDKVRALIAEKNNGRLPFTSDYAEADFGLVDIWDVEEKIDGKNISMVLNDKKKGEYRISIFGRNGQSLVSKHLEEYLRDTFTVNKVMEAIGGLGLMIQKGRTANESLTLFGEGYGEKIQGDYYKIGEPRFALFDIISCGIWSNRDKVRTVGERLGLIAAPYLGQMTELEIVEFIKSKPKSRINPDVTMEGIIARGEAWNVDKEGYSSFKSRNKFKLRCEDF